MMLIATIFFFGLAAYYFSIMQISNSPKMSSMRFLYIISLRVACNNASGGVAVAARNRSI